MRAWIARPSNARFECIKQRALKTAEEEIQRELVALGKISSVRPHLAADRLRARRARAVRTA